MSFFKWFSKKEQTPKSSEKKRESLVSQQRSNDRFPSSSQRPPSKRQIEECQLLGIKIGPNTTSRRIWELIEKAKSNPPTKAIWEAHCREQREKEYLDLIEEYTDEFGSQVAETVIGDYRQWQEDSLDGFSCHRLIVFKKGKTIAADVMELESVEIQETTAGKPFVALSFLRPKVYKGRADESPWIEWNKKFILKPNQVFKQHKLDESIDMFDIERYERVIAGAQAFVEKIAARS